MALGSIPCQEEKPTAYEVEPHEFSVLTGKYAQLLEISYGSISIKLEDKEKY